jgi:Bacterial TniB protein
MKNNYQDTARKLTQFSKKFIHHHAAAQALRLMERAIQAVESMRTANGEIDPHFQPKDFNFKLVGKTGTGKTTLCEKTLSSHYPRDIVINDVTVRSVPCLFCSVESPPTIKNLAKSMLTCLEDTEPDKGTVYDVTSRVKTLLKNCRTNLIIIDEFHHLLNGTAKKTAESLDWLKRLNDDTRIPIVVCGLPDSLALFQNESQMAKRFPKDILLSEHKWSISDDTPGEFGRYCAPLLKNIESISEAEFAFKYRTNTFLKRLFVATAGLATDIDTLLKAVIEISLQRGCGKILMDDFESGYKSVNLINSSYNGNLSPFTCDVSSLQKLLRGMHL